MHTEYLAHYGVKGMKWGVRKKRDRKNPVSKLSERRAFAKDPSTYKSMRMFNNVDEYNSAVIKRAAQKKSSIQQYKHTKDAISKFKKVGTTYMTSAGYQGQSPVGERIANHMLSNMDRSELAYTSKTRRQAIKAAVAKEFGDYRYLAVKDRDGFNPWDHDKNYSTIGGITEYVANWLIDDAIYSKTH